MPDRILTSHAGSLPRPEDLIALNEQRAAGDFTEEAVYLGRLRAAVADVVARQRDTGVGGIGDLHTLVELGYLLLNANETRPCVPERSWASRPGASTPVRGVEAIRDRLQSKSASHAIDESPPE